MNGFVLSVLVLGRILAATSADDRIGLEQTDVFVAGELGYKEFRIPVLVVTKRGVLLAVSEAGRSSSDFGDRDLLLRRSADGGRTWSEAQMLRDKGTRTCGNATVIVDRIDGRIHMLSTVDGRHLFYNYSDDNGLGWSQFCEITEVLESFRSEFAWNRFATGSGLSYDEGKTWPVAKQIFAGPSAYSCLTKLPDGDIGLLYECGERHRYQKMTFARFSLGWLTEGKDKFSGR